MKNYFFVTAHPEPQSFNHALSNQAAKYLQEQGHQVQHSDLYAMQWQPVSDRRNFTSVSNPNYFKQQLEELHATQHDGFSPDIAAEMEKLFWCDVLVLQFPLWWFGMPAIMKGWIDKVLAFEKIYARDKWFETGSFRGKKALLSLTTGGQQSDYGEGGLHPSMDALLLPIHHGVLKFNGFEVLPPCVVWQVAHITHEQRENYLSQFQQKLAQI